TIAFVPKVGQSIDQSSQVRLARMFAPVMQLRNTVKSCESTSPSGTRSISALAQPGPYKTVDPLKHSCKWPKSELSTSPSPSKSGRTLTTLTLTITVCGLLLASGAVTLVVALSFPNG